MNRDVTSPKDSASVENKTAALKKKKIKTEKRLREPVRDVTRALPIADVELPSESELFYNQSAWIF